MKPARLAAKSLVLTFLVAASGLTLAACASQEPLPVAVIAPASPPPPPVALSAPVVEQAAAFRTYLRKAAAISPGFRGGPDVEQAMAMAVQSEPVQLSKGAIAYAAVVALQDTQFVASVRTYAVDPQGRKSLARKLMNDPNYAAALPGASGAAGLVIATLNAEGAKVRGVGELVKQAAYDVQHQKWSKDPVPNPALRLAQAKTASAAPMTSVPGDVVDLKVAVGGPGSAVGRLTTTPGGPVSGPYTPVVARGLTIAALAALGEGGDDSDANVQAVLNSATDGFCLNMSKLNLYQCLAVAKPYYEDVFCLGQHVLIDTGQCIAKAAGTPAPVMAMQPVSLASGMASAAPIGASASIGGVR